MANFDFLLAEKKFDVFSEAAIVAEKVINIDFANPFRLSSFLHQYTVFSPFREEVR